MEQAIAFKKTLVNNREWAQRYRQYASTGAEGQQMLALDKILPGMKE